jgi:nitroreductase
MPTGAEMSFAAAVERRVSVRRFRSDPVPRADVERMVELATRAASAGNGQMWRFIAIRDRNLLARMREAVVERFEELTTWPALADRWRQLMAARAHALFFAEAPLCIAVLALPYASRMDELLDLACVSREEHDRLRQRPDLQSVGAAVQLLITSAYATGYGACWMCAPVVAAQRLETLLRVKPPARLAALVPIGRPDGTPKASPRLPLSRVLSFR